jgi:RNA polymerase sigma-70 factor (sigma-E family)
VSRDAQFHAFVTAHSPALLRFAYLLTAEPVAAEDLLQIALLRAYRRWRRIDDPLPYVRRVLTTVAVDEGRRAYRRREELVDAPHDRPVTDDGPARRDERELLAAALRTLPAGQRAAVVCRYWLDLDPDACADLLGCSATTVRTQAMRGLAKLRTALTEPPIPNEPQEVRHGR